MRQGQVQPIDTLVWEGAAAAYDLVLWHERNMALLTGRTEVEPTWQPGVDRTPWLSPKVRV